MTAIGISVDAFDSVRSAHQDFIMLLIHIEFCIKGDNEKIPLTESLDRLIVSSKNSGNKLGYSISHNLRGSIENSYLEKSGLHKEMSRARFDKSIIVDYVYGKYRPSFDLHCTFTLMCIEYLTNIGRKINQEKLVQETRSNLFLPDRNGLYIDNLEELIRNIDASSHSVIDYIKLVNSWRNGEEKSQDFQSLVERLCDLSSLIHEHLLAVRNSVTNILKSYLSGSKAINSHNNDQQSAPVLTGQEIGEKLKFSCNPATAGFILATLVEMGYLDPPVKLDGSTNDTALAKACLQLFEFEGASPTVDSMRKNLNIHSNSGNQLSNDNRAMFKIPHKSKLTASNASTLRNT